VIKDYTDGVFGGAMWLNRVAGPRREKPYPASPDDMFFALGHHGQLIVVLPTLNMVIARTGWDELYSNKIDAFVSRAVSCFTHTNGRPGDVVPVPETLKPSFSNSVKTLFSALSNNVVQAAVAKSVCSCVFVSGLDRETCRDRSNIPLAGSITSMVFKRDKSKSRVAVHLSWLGRLLAGHDAAAKAEFDWDHPELGCRLR
jgi:hypothetical protein